MTDGRQNNGGARDGAGRKSVKDIEKQNKIFLDAVHKITKDPDNPKDQTDDEAKTALIVKLWNAGGRGQMFIAEHIFGKAPDIIELNKKTEFPDLSNFSTKDLKALLKGGK